MREETSGRGEGGDRLRELEKRVSELESVERKMRLAEETLQVSEKKYRTIFLNTGTATILIEEDTTIAMVNAEFEKLSGFSRGEVEGKKSWQVFIAPEDLGFMLEYHRLRRSGEERAPRNYECRLIDKSGGVRTCAMTVAMIPGTAQSVASLMDITERIRAGEALRESEERYRLLVETMNEGLGIQDAHGVITYVNPRICEMMGYPREEIMGKPTIELLEERYRPLWQAQMEKKGGDRYEPYEVAWKDRSGQPIHTIVSPKPLFDAKGNFSGSFAVFTDISGRKKAEKALALSEEKFSKAFRSSPVAVTITTIGEGRFIDVNESFQKITGWERGEIIDHTVADLRIWPDAEYRVDLVGRLRAQGSLHNIEVQFRVRSGEMRTGIYSAELIDLQGTGCLISVFADVTEQRRLERELVNISERERRKIGQDLHDDLQQHLIGIEALSALLGRRLARGSRGTGQLAREIGELIREAVEKTRRLARGLCPVYLDENGLVAALGELAASVSGAFSIECVFAHDEDVAITDNTTAVNLFHITQEAVGNAVRHGRARRVEVRLARAGDDIVIEVSDDGCGFDPRTVSAGGMGLGIMRHRARTIGGGFDILPREGGGTVLRCTLRQKS
ncbi:MAG: PAS domain-containing sensor histidine kinase [Spirochaetes bacterium]|nr:MAG: PAS domain-containing sensor histidine kinase [Spirochaetota bacterium]